MFITVIMLTDDCRSSAYIVGNPVSGVTVSLLTVLPDPDSFAANSWNSLVHKSFEIERVCLELEREIAVLKQHAKERFVYV